METGVLQCGACGGPVGPDEMVCRSCGSQVATVACPNCMGMVSVHAKHCGNCGAAITPTEELPTELGCPGCRKAKLSRSILGGVEVDQCLLCGGVWLRQDLFDKVAGDKEVRGRALGALPTVPHTQATMGLEVIYRPCPACSQMMNRYNYARISGVLVDGCKRHGLWFDKDELRQVLEFIQGGGLDKSHERDVARLDEEQRAKAQMVRMDLGMHPSSSTEFQSQWGRSGGLGILSALVDGLVDHFIV